MDKAAEKTAKPTTKLGFMAAGSRSPGFGYSSGQGAIFCRATSVNARVIEFAHFPWETISQSHKNLFTGRP